MDSDRGVCRTTQHGARTFVLIAEIPFPTTTGNSQSTPPKDSPLGCHLKALGLADLKPRHLIFYCNTAWSQNKLGDQEVWPMDRSLNYNTISANLTFTVTVWILSLGSVPGGGDILTCSRDSSLFLLTRPLHSNLPHSSTPPPTLVCLATE